MAAPSEVDLDKLRAKWAAHSQAHVAPSVDSLELREALARASASTADVEEAKAGTKVDKMIICIECQGLGTVNERYNHMSISKTCTHCDGDGTVQRPTYKLADSAESAEEVEVPDDLPPLESI